MATYSFQTANPTRNTNTTMRREVIIFPTCALPASAIKVTSISLYFCFRTSWGGINVTDKFVISNSTNTPNLSGWSSSYVSSNSCYYQTTNTSSTYFNSSYYTNHMASNVQLVNYDATFATGGTTSSGTGNTWKTVTLTPTTYGQDPANWRNKTIYLGAYFIKATTSSGSSSSLSDCLWGTNVSGYKITITYEENTAPTTPTISIPSSDGKTTYNTKPYFTVTMGTDAQQSSTTLYYKVDSASYQTKASCANSTAYEVQWPTALSAGSHTLTVYANDGQSVNNTSSTATRTFTVGTPQAAVSVGGIIDDATIDGLQSNIKTQQTYYGQTNSSFTTCDAGTTILDDHIDQMETAIEALPHPTALTSVDAGTKATAATMNAIRNALLNA